MLVINAVYSERHLGQEGLWAFLGPSSRLIVSLDFDHERMQGEQNEWRQVLSTMRSLMGQRQMEQSSSAMLEVSDASGVQVKAARLLGEVSASERGRLA
jgi:hypothetical protein